MHPAGGAASHQRLENDDTQHRGDRGATEEQQLHGGVSSVRAQPTVGPSQVKDEDGVQKQQRQEHFVGESAGERARERKRLPSPRPRGVGTQRLQIGKQAEKVEAHADVGLERRDPESVRRIVWEERVHQRYRDGQNPRLAELTHHEIEQYRAEREHPRVEHVVSGRLKAEQFVQAHERKPLYRPQRVVVGGLERAKQSRWRLILGQEHGREEGPVVAVEAQLKNITGRK